MTFQFKNNFDKNSNPTNLNFNKFNIFKNFTKTKINLYLHKYTLKDDLTQDLSLILYNLYEGLNISDKSDTSKFLSQLSMNNNQDIFGIINLYFPYLNDKDNMKNQKNMKTIRNVIESKNENLQTSNKFDVCNYFYDHSYIKDIEKIQKNDLSNIHFKIKNKLLDNFDSNYKSDILFFILDLIDRVRYKLYINWINVFPITLENYKNTLLYQNSFKNINDTKQNLIFGFGENIPSGIFFKSFMDINNQDCYNIIDKYFSKYLEIKSSYIQNLFTNVITSSSIYTNLYYGINLEDIYNTFVYDFYYSIIDYKWLIYELVVNDKNILYIQMLHDILDLDTIIDDDILILTDSNKKKFNNNLSNYIRAISNNLSIKDYSHESLETVFIYLLLKFESKYSKINKLIKNEDKIINKDKDKNNIIRNKEIDEDTIMFGKGNITFKYNDSNAIQTINVSNFMSNYQNFNYHDHIYDFLFEQIQYLKTTIYRNYLFEYSSNNDYKLNLRNLKFNRYKDDDDDIELSPKNYYNFGESLQIEKNDNINKTTVKFSKLWEGLSIEQKVYVSVRLNINYNDPELKIENDDSDDRKKEKKKRKEDIKWFQISKILKEKLNYNGRQIELIEDLIYNKIRNEIVDKTFTNLIYKGCISKFELNPTVSDDTILSTEYNTSKKRFAENMKKHILTNEKIEEYKKGYYYVNNKRYDNQEKFTIRSKKDDKEIDIENYVEYLSKIEDTEDTWMRFYANNWISQLSFYLRFLNQRVMYITGATGQGKSTQVPKLYLYGLKSFYYKNNGKVLCTVPRIDPVEENAGTISGSMGLPYKSYNKDLDEEIRTLNKGIQFQHSKDYHKSDSNFYLRILTDGSVLDNLLNNQSLKVKEDNGNKIDEDYEVREDNFCDVILVDEAHEHNVNMDLILTTMRYNLLYNNDIKLGVISATMEVDEPIFRRYYRFIDDNFAYPINLCNLYFSLNKNIIDRRYHISPPGKTTQHKVTEFYEESSFDTYKHNEKLAIDKVIELFRTTSSGDILLFSNTTNNIKKIVKQLNEKIPPNCIALPYFGELSNEFKKYSTKPSSNLKKLDVDKSIIYDYFINALKENELIRVSKGTYNRVCIIATNAAEASLTVTTLKFVVDIGYQLTVKYNYELGITENKVEKITEASRVQRRGRVGRVSSGTVYHMYPKDSRIPIKSIYNISLENFNKSFLKILAQNFDKRYEVIDTNIFINILCFKKERNEDNLRELNRSSVSKYIYEQYLIPELLYDDTNNPVFVRNEESFSSTKTFLEILLPSYKSGFSSDSLIDLNGIFYINNPLDDKYTRNLISGNIVDSNNQNKIITINSDEFKLRYNELILSHDIIQIDNGNFYYKSDKQSSFDNFNQKINNYDEIFAKILLMSMIYDYNSNNNIYIKNKNHDKFTNDYEEIYNLNDHYYTHLLTFTYKLLLKIDFNIANLFNLKYFKTFKELNKIKVEKTELSIFYDLFILFSKSINFTNLNNNSKIEIDEINKNLNNYFINKKISYTNLIKLFSKNKNSKNIKIFTKIIKDVLKNNKKLDFDFDDNFKSLFISNYIEDKRNIKDLCKYNNLNYDLIKDTLVEYLHTIEKIRYSDFYEHLNDLNEILLINNISKDKLKTLKLIYLFGHFTNSYYIEKGNINNLLRNKIHFKKYDILKNTSVLGFYLQEKIQEDTNKNEIFLLSNINKEDIFNFYPLFTTNTKKIII